MPRIRTGINHLSQFYDIVNYFHDYLLVSIASHGVQLDPSQ